MNSANELEINGLQTSDFKGITEADTVEIHTQKMGKYVTEIQKKRPTLLKEEEIEAVNIECIALKFTDDIVADLYDGNPLGYSFAERAQMVSSTCHKVRGYVAPTLARTYTS